MAQTAGGQSWGGVIGDTWRESTPWWPPEPAPPPGRAERRARSCSTTSATPQLGCYGSDIDTPEIDRLAAGGVRLANFHTTALCSPTRACLLTGRNHHSVGMGRVADLAIGFPGYCGRIARSHGFPSEILARSRLRDLRRRQVAPHPRGRDPHGRVPRELAGRAAASSGGTASTAARRTSSSRRCTRTTSGSGRRAGPEDGYHLSVDLADHAIALPRRPPGRRRRAAVLPLLRDRCLPLAAPRAARVDRALRGPLRRGAGTTWRSGPSPASSSSG